ncbi:hypothetical protein [Streptomyces sp. NPDC090022]|uniref:hypothetical protein n=1 Tax=Streptomyces sp. NPDC090022 TaxID=3365920 RepID=UPI00381E8323
MSPTPGAPGTVRHPDVSEISDLAEGLLSPTRSAEVRSHLTDCVLCADVRTSLEEIRSLLGTLPGPARMPSDIAGRIDAALAAEALLDATSPRTDEGATGTAPAPAPARHVSRETSAPVRPAGRPRAATGPGRKRRQAVLAGLTAAAALSLGVFLLQLPWGQEQQSGSKDAAASVLTSPSDSAAFSEGGLEAQVRELLGPPAQTRKSTPDSQNGLSATESGPSETERQGSGIPGCVQQGTGRTEAPLASERGTYKGVNVYLVVLPHPGDPTRVDAYLVDSACENAPAAAAGKLVLTRTYNRL